MLNAATTVFGGVNDFSEQLKAELLHPIYARVYIRKRLNRMWKTHLYLVERYLGYVAWYKLKGHQNLGHCLQEASFNIVFDIRVFPHYSRSLLFQFHITGLNIKVLGQLQSPLTHPVYACEMQFVSYYIGYSTLVERNSIRKNSFAVSAKDFNPY